METSPVNRIWFECCRCPSLAPGTAVEDTIKIGIPRGWGVFLRSDGQAEAQKPGVVDQIKAFHPIFGTPTTLAVHYVCPECLKQRD